MDTEAFCRYPAGWHLLQCGHGSRVWLPKRCRVCVGCRAARRGKVLARLHAGIATSSNTGFLTLTSLPGTPWPAVMKAFALLVRALKKRSPLLAYAAIKEVGSRNGMCHLHVLLLNFNYTPQAQIARRWRQLTGAWVVNVQRVAGPQAAVYCAKYVSKGDVVWRKTVTYSRGWPPLPDLECSARVIAELGPAGPQKWSAVTPMRGLVVKLEAGCSCFGACAPTPPEVVYWLRYLQGHSPPVSPAESVQWSSNRPASAR